MNKCGGWKGSLTLSNFRIAPQIVENYFINKKRPIYSFV